MLGTTGTVVNPDVYADTEHDLALEAGIEVRPTQPPHPSLVVDVPSGYLEDLGTFGTPDTINIEDILRVDVTPFPVWTPLHVQTCLWLNLCLSTLVHLCQLISMIVCEKFKVLKLPTRPQAPVRSSSEIVHYSNHMYGSSPSSRVGDLW